MTNSISKQQPDPSEHAPAGESAPTVECQICQAVYAPAEEYRYLAQAPQVALESAFMSMCHFCFRCRRPACPQCWDNVHGVCGKCSQEVNLPFRSQAAPLRGVLFPSARQAQLKRKQSEAIRLRCINPGRFQTIAPIDEAETIPYLPKTRTGNQTQVAPPSALSPSSTRPSQSFHAIPPHTQTMAPRPTSLVSQSETAKHEQWQPQQPRRTRQLDMSSTAAPPTSIPYPVPVPPLSRGKKETNGVEDIVTRPERASSPRITKALDSSRNTEQLRPTTERVTSKKIAAQSEIQGRRSAKPRERETLEEIVTHPARNEATGTTSPGNTSTNTARPAVLAKRATIGKATITRKAAPNTAQKRPTTRRKTGLQLFEVLLTYLLTVFLFGILILIVVANMSPAANTSIFQLLHVDIHTELITLWHLIRP
ncbi:hypothetical protein ccbrp13_34800 [Ktedonobacteria bacterium brp13]|nr:hypothetical protein ccbrp13_34800 [Ktedonobacteria bacterium brp13]